MQTAIRVVAILAIPVLWGLGAARLLEWLRARRTRACDRDEQA